MEWCFFFKYFSDRINVLFVCRHQMSVTVVQLTPSFVFQIKDNARNSRRLGVTVRVDYKVLISIC